MAPSIGRIVHYYETPTANPLAAIITAVWSMRCVNLAIFNPSGQAMSDPPTSVVLVGEAESPPTGGRFCTWPPRVE
ncbi:MAG: hypothetical protein H0T51_07880 [Pirellulales bacterium]|nr:hypothetical protein [Pirellulales bacterium]